MVIAHHLIWTVYGWWLPNDPRGSSSHEIRVEPIAALGPLHYGRKPIQPPPEEFRRFHAEARDVLKHSVLTFTDDDIVFVGDLLGRVIRERGYTCYACAIMPEHVHLLIRRHRDQAEVMLTAFQSETRKALIAAGRRTPTHPVWGGPGWKVFLRTADDVARIIDYIHNNPAKAGRPRQDWPFVARYDRRMPAYSQERGARTYR